MFQFPVVYDTMTVYDNLAFPLRNMKTPEAKVRSRVSEVAELLELNTVLDKRASNLTADEKQKVSMGRGLVREDVSAILFDEPLTVIDPHLKWKLRRKLRQIHEQFHITMIYVTHDQLEAATFAEEIAVMYDGAIVQFGSPRELFERPNHTFVGFFIGSPGMNLLPVSRTSDGNVQFEDTAITLTQSQRDALAATQSQNVKVGIRPEFIHVWQEARPIHGKCRCSMWKISAPTKSSRCNLALSPSSCALPKKRRCPRSSPISASPHSAETLYRRIPDWRAAGR